jgi:hypothetical protein
MVAALVSLLAATTVPAIAQTRIGIEGTFTAPTGDLDDVADRGGGGGGFIAIPVTPDAHFRIDAGYQIFAKDKVPNEDGAGEVEVTSWVVPIRAGGLWYFGPRQGTRLHVGIYVGTYVRNFDAAGDESTNLRFGLAPELGTTIPLGGGRTAIEISGSFDWWFGEKMPISREGVTMRYLRLNLGLSFGFGEG